MSRDQISPAALRAAVKRAASVRGDVTHVPRIGPLDVATFRAFAEAGIPFVIVGLVEHWPIARFTPETLVAQFGELPVTARVGDYVKTAFSPKREMEAMPLARYFEILQSDAAALPPYLGNQQLPALASLCKWPRYFEQYKTPRIWLGPANTVTPLHCDFTDNLFAQIWGYKRFALCAPHHDAVLGTREANPLLFASTFNPEAPDYAKFPRARQIPWLDCVVAPGELLYLPSGWFHQVRALEFSLSANRWAMDPPMALSGARAGGTSLAGNKENKACEATC